MLDKCALRRHPENCADAYRLGMQYCRYRCPEHIEPKTDSGRMM